MVHPRAAWKRSWDGLILALVVYSSTYELYRTAFKESDLGWLDWCVDLCYWLDIFLTCITGYDDDGRGREQLGRHGRSAASLFHMAFQSDRSEGAFRC